MNSTITATNGLASRPAGLRSTFSPMSPTLWNGGGYAPLFPVVLWEAVRAYCAKRQKQVSANRATSLDIIRREQLYSIPFLARQSRGATDALDDSDGSSLDPPYDTLSMIQEMVDLKSDWKTRREQHSIPAVRSQFGEHQEEPWAGPDTCTRTHTVW